MRYAVLTFLILITSFVSEVFSMGSSPKMIPMNAKSFKIQDGEYLKYGFYTGGEKTAEVYLLTRLDKVNDAFTVYWYTRHLYSSVFLNVPPKNTTDFQMKFQVSQNNASLETLWIDRSKIIKDRKKFRGAFSYRLETEQKIHEAAAVQNNWNGYAVKTVRSRMKTKPGFPLWDGNSMVFIGFRFLDVRKGGVLYLIEPDYVKEPIPVSTVYLGKETIETKAGKFLTSKYGFIIADPFLGSLLRAYTKVSFVWVEDGPAGLVVQAQMPPNLTGVLEENSFWRN